MSDLITLQGKRRPRVILSTRYPLSIYCEQVNLFKKCVYTNEIVDGHEYDHDLAKAFTP